MNKGEEAAPLPTSSFASPTHLIVSLRQKKRENNPTRKSLHSFHCFGFFVGNLPLNPAASGKTQMTTGKINGSERREEGEELEEEEAHFVREFLQRHNELRKLHGSPELTLSEELCRMAAEWANKLASKGHVSFAEISGIGENVTVFPAEKCAREMVDYWYEENRKYEYDAPGWQEGTNYFSQIIWRSTKEIGVSRALMRRHSPLLLEKSKRAANIKDTEEGAQKSVVVVAFYRPAGNSNRSGQFMLNVSKPQ